MKRILLILLCLAFWLPAGASMINLPYVQDVQAAFVIGSGGEEVSCTSEWSNAGTPDTDADIFDVDTFKYVGQFITPASQVTVCQVDFYLTHKIGDISGKTFRAYLCTESGDDLGVLTEADSTVAGSNSWSNTAVTFEWSSGYTMSVSTRYAIVITMDGTADASNYAELEITETSSVFPDGAGGAARWLADYSINGGWAGDEMMMVIYTE